MRSYIFSLELPKIDISKIKRKLEQKSLVILDKSVLVFVFFSPYFSYVLFCVSSSSVTSASCFFFFFFLHIRYFFHICFWVLQLFIFFNEMSIYIQFFNKIIMCKINLPNKGIKVNLYKLYFYFPTFFFNQTKPFFILSTKHIWKKNKFFLSFHFFISQTKRTLRVWLTKCPERIC